MKVRGVLMAQKNGTLTFLLEGGEFYNVAQKHYPTAKIGDELIIRKRINYPKFVMPLVASIMLFFILSSTFTNTIYGYITIDINPSIELTIGKKHKILEVNPLNQRGEEISQNLALIGKTMDLALNEIIIQFEQEGFFVDEANIFFTTVSTEKNNNQLDSEIEQIVNNAIHTNGLQVKSYVIPANLAQRDKSKENGVSTAKQMIEDISNQKGLNIDKEELRDKGINQTLKNNGLDVDEIVKEAKNSKNNGNSKKDEEHPSNNSNKQKDENHPLNNSNKQKDANHPSNNSNNEKDENQPSNNPNKQKDANHPSNNSNKHKDEDHPSNKSNKSGNTNTPTNHNTQSKNNK